MTISKICEQAGIRANATDPTILAYSIQEVVNWLESRVRTHRWDFMKVPASGNIISGATFITLPANFWKVHTVSLLDTAGNQIPLEVKSYDDFSRIQVPGTTGVPFMSAVFDNKLYVYYIPANNYTYSLTYYRTIGVIGGTTVNTLFPDDIIEQVAYIAALKYDRLDTINEEAILETRVANFRRNQEETGSDGSTIPMSPNQFGNPPRNYI